MTGFGGGSDGFVERISGPYRGYYVAAYAHAAGGGDFRGYAKICLSPPGDVWTCAALMKLGTSATSSAEGALQLAEQRARDAIRHIGQAQEDDSVPAQAPTGPAKHSYRWWKIIGVALLALLGLSMLDGMACSLYARRTANAGPPSSDALYRPASLLEGRLCGPGTACTPALLVEGLVSTDTIRAIEARAADTRSQITVCFNSPGGSYEATGATLPTGVRTCVADVVRGDGLSPSRALCASACAWLWLAGEERRIYGANAVGFHAPYEFDAPACAPGNTVKGVLSVVAGWVGDRVQSRHEPAIRSARNTLRLASLFKGPAEVYDVDAAAAAALGLQSVSAGTAIFYLAAPPQAIAPR